MAPVRTKARFWLVVPHGIFGLVLLACLVVGLRTDGVSPVFDAAFAITHIFGFVFSMVATRRRRIEGHSIRPWVFFGAFFGISIAEGVIVGALLSASGGITATTS